MSKERRSLVQAMQLSNGLTDPAGLWLGHLMFDSVFCVLAASLIIIIFAAASDHFAGLGFFVSIQYRSRKYSTIDLTDDSGGSGSSWYSMASLGRYFRIVHRSLFRRLLPHLPCRQPMV